MSTVQGSKEIAAALKKHQKGLTKGMEIGLFRAGTFLQRLSQKLVPVDDNVLKPSANTRWAEPMMPGKPEVVVSYSTDYAVYVHEDLNAKHKIGQAKYLETPYRVYKDVMVGIVRDAMKGKA